MNFESKLAEYIDQVNSAVDSALPASGESGVGDAMRYAAEGGKRVRGVLVLAFADMLGGHNGDSLKSAAALELIHAYSLVHDDLPCMDDDDMRRGKPSTHKRYGEALGLLAGDGLLTLAFYTLGGLSHRAEQAVATVAELAGFRGMIGGQELDLVSQDGELAADRLIAMQEKKTGALFCASAKLGSLSVGADETVAVRFAASIGRVFQIVDDILDADDGSDDDRSTFVSVFGLGESRSQARTITESACDELRAQYGDAADFLCEYAERLVGRIN